MSDEQGRIDRTPDGEPIDTFTMWLDFPEGEIAISADVTKFNAAMRQLRAAGEDR